MESKLLSSKEGAVSCPTQYFTSPAQDLAVLFSEGAPGVQTY